MRCALLHLLEDVPEKLELQKKTLEVEGVSKVEILLRKAAGHKQTWARKEVTARMRNLTPPPAARLGTVMLNVSPAEFRSCLAISFLSTSACILPEMGKPTLGHCTGNPLK